MEPANVHGYCATFWESLWDCHSIIGVIGFAPGAGYLPEACISFKMHYLGFGQTPTAERVMRRYMFKCKWDSMCKPGSPH